MTGANILIFVDDNLKNESYPYCTGIVAPPTGSGLRKRADFCRVWQFIMSSANPENHGYVEEIL